MRVENEALSEKGFVNKKITVTNLPNGNYEVKATAITTGNLATGKIDNSEVTMQFTQNGLSALIGSLMAFEMAGKK